MMDLFCLWIGRCVMVAGGASLTCVIFWAVVNQIKVASGISLKFWQFCMDQARQKEGRQRQANEATPHAGGKEG